VKFIFCTTEATKIPVTVLSRCQRFDFAGIQPTSIAQRLAEIVANEGLHAEPEALAILARRAAGSMRDSQSLLEQLLSFGGQEIRVTDVHALLGTADTQRLLKLAEMVAGGDAAGALAELDTAVTEGVDVGEMLEQLLGLLRDAMTALAGCGGEVMLFATSTAEQQAVAKIGESLGLERILAMLQIVEETLSRLRYSTHRRTLAEVALVRLCRLEDLETIATLAAQLAQGGTPPAGGAPRPAPRVAGAASAAPAADLAAKKKPPAEPLTAPVAVSQSAVSSQPVSESAPSVPEQSPARVPGASLGPAAVGEARVPGASEAPPQTVPANTSASPIEVETPPVAAVAVRPAPIPAPHVSVPSSRQEVEPESFAYDEPSDASTLDEPTSYDAPRSSSSKAPFPSDEAAEKAWNACLEKLSGMVAARGKNYQKVAMKGPRLEVTFSETYNFCKSFFEQHERRRVVEQTLSEIAGTEVHVNFMITQAGAAPAAAAEAPRQVSPAQRMKVIHEHVMVRRASELFGSKIDIVE
ncbi:MAG: hypothetical protein K8T91_17705, partial [Planctomycetes bacterium]|nr:hypothetical protein [Planctomycetota bacterium]